MTCPRCGIENPPGTANCEDCGNPLSGSGALRLDQLDAIERHVRTIKNVVVAAFVLAVAGAVIYGAWVGVVVSKAGK